MYFLLSVTPSAPNINLTATVKEGNRLSVVCEASIPTHGGTLRLQALRSNTTEYTNLDITVNITSSDLNLQSCTRATLHQYEFIPLQSWNGTDLRCQNTNSLSDSSVSSDAKTIVIIPAGE